MSKLNLARWVGVAMVAAAVGLGCQPTFKKGSGMGPQPWPATGIYRLTTRDNKTFYVQLYYDGSAKRMDAPFDENAAPRYLKSDSGIWGWVGNKVVLKPDEQGKLPTLVLVKDGEKIFKQVYAAGEPITGTPISVSEAVRVPLVPGTENDDGGVGGVFGWVGW